MLRAALLILIALPPLAACGPVPLDQAERLCVEEANQARRPRGEDTLVGCVPLLLRQRMATHAHTRVASHA